MFISSYNTFVQTATSQKIDKQANKPHIPADNFSSKLLQKTEQTSLANSVQTTTNNYNQNTLRTKQEVINQQNKNYEPVKEVLKKFNGQNTLLQASSAYVNNARMFSLSRQSHATLNQTPSLENTLPKEPMEIKEANLRYKMVNTYLANDNYYKVTA